MKRTEAGLLAGKVPYIRGGTGEREAVVFFGANALFKRLHQTSNPGRYVSQVARLIPGHRFTILGYGSSSFHEIMGDTVRSLRAPPDIVMGISFGGFVAMQLAAQHPELARRLILLVSAHRFSSAGRGMIERQFEALERRDLQSLIRENALLFRRPWYNWLLRFKFWKDRDRLEQGFRDPAAILDDYRQLLGPDLKSNADAARRIVSPTLILGGTADQYFDRRCFQETADLIPGARLHLVEGETHMLPIERSREVAAAIRQFLGQP